MRILLPILLAFWLTPVSGQAVLDLSNYDFSGPNTRLNGKWEFYWDQLVSPDDLNKKTIAHTLVDIPSSWSYGSNLPGLGKGTYRLRIELPKGSRPDLSFYFPPVRCAAKVWVNGILKDSIGTVGNHITYRSRLSGLLLSVPATDQVELVVQVANYDYRTGGLVSGVRIGRTSAIQRDINIKSGLDTIFAGSLLAMFVYLVMMYLLYRRGAAFLFLGLICLAVALRTVVIESGSVLLPQLFPESGWGLWKKIEFFSVYSIVALFPLYVSSVFPTVSNRKIDWIFIAVATGLCIVVIATPHYIYGQLLDISHAGLLAGFVYAVWVISRGLTRKIQDARILLTGVLAAFPFILLEIIKNTSFLNIRLPFTYLVESGVLTFLIFQVYVLGNHYAKAYQSLEKLVDERTFELSQANKIKDKLLSIVSHDIKGPFNSLRGIIILFNQGFVKGEELGPVMKQIESQMGVTNLLIENVLFWVRSQMTGIVTTLEPVLLAELVNEHISLYANAAAAKKLQLINDVDSKLFVHADKNILSLVLRNLISNAIKYSFENGKVKIATSQSNGTVTLSIEDNGTGMSPATLAKLLQHEEVLTSQTGTSNEMGTGLGLMVSREYLQQMGSTLSIQSTLGQGSTFSMVLNKQAVSRDQAD